VESGEKVGGWTTLIYQKSGIYQWIYKEEYDCKII